MFDIKTQFNLLPNSSSDWNKLNHCMSYVLFLTQYEGSCNCYCTPTFLRLLIACSLQCNRLQRTSEAVCLAWWMCAELLATVHAQMHRQLAVLRGSVKHCGLLMRLARYKSVARLLLRLRAKSAFIWRNTVALFPIIDQQTTRFYVHVLSISLSYLAESPHAFG